MEKIKTLFCEFLENLDQETNETSLLMVIEHTLETAKDWNWGQLQFGLVEIVRALLTECPWDVFEKAKWILKLKQLNLIAAEAVSLRHLVNNPGTIVDDYLKKDRDMISKETKDYALKLICMSFEEILKLAGDTVQCEMEFALPDKTMIATFEIKKDKSILTRLKDANNRIVALEESIRTHRDKKGNDRCYEDDYVLYNTLPEGFDKEDMRLDSPVKRLLECIKYNRTRHDSSQPYCSPQEEVERLKKKVEELEQENKRLLEK